MTSVSVFSDVVCRLGEGPSAHAALGRVYWFDILEKRLFERRFDAPGTTVHQLPVMASVMAPIDGGRQLIAAEDGLYVRDVTSGALTLLTPLEADKPANRSNDGRVHPSGALWIGTMGRKAEDGAGAIWWFRKGELRCIVPSISISNAISFDPAGRFAYFADTKIGTIFRIGTDPETGLPTGEPKVFRTIAPASGGPDGAVVDADGVLWCARWGGAALDAFAPDGSLLRSLVMPASQVSCPAFMGPNADRMIITSAHDGMSSDERSKDPMAGLTFHVDFPVRGRFDPPVVIA
jgi:sugar lactone lactonase YvrE